MSCTVECEPTEGEGQWLLQAALGFRVRRVKGCAGQTTGSISILVHIIMNTSNSFTGPVHCYLISQECQLRLRVKPSSNEMIE